MAYYPIVSRNQEHMESGCPVQLPHFYMADFSVLGLQVNDCDRAVAILKRHQFALQPFNGCLAVNIAGTHQAARAIDLLNENGLGCELTDVAQGMYQG